MFTTFVSDRQNACAVFEQSFGQRMSIEYARENFKKSVLKDIINRNRLSGKASSIVKILKNTNATPEQMADVITVASSGAIASQRGKELERICEEIAHDAAPLFPGVKVVRQAADSTGQIIQNADLQIVLPNGNVLNFAIQISLWGGGQQQQRASDYFLKCAQLPNFYCVIGETIDDKFVKPLLSPRPNKQKKIFEPLLGLSTAKMIYPTEIVQVISHHLTQK